MTTDIKSFFREATLRICGSLDIEKAFGRFFQFAQRYFPVQEGYLHYYDDSLGVARFFVKADATGGSLIDVRARWPEKLRQLTEAEGLPLCFISNRAESHPMSRLLLEALGKGKSSIMTVRLTLGRDWVGGLTLWAGDWNQFNQDNLDLLAELREPVSIALSNYRRYRELLALKDSLADDYSALKEELDPPGEDPVIGARLGLRRIMEMARQVAPLDSPVLVMGETGVGKELITRAIHRLSGRRDGPFIKVNCGAIAESLVDTELFGHEKGAFTGAIRLKRGRLERAHRGSLFLDEVGELPLDAQVKLLRALQEKELERVGGTQPIPADFRLIAATNRNLEDMIDAGTFRRDLYFRLNVFPLTAPPLRERMCDLPELTHHFMRKKALEMKFPHIPVLAPGALQNLMAYSWPGNVRELENAVERELILSRGAPLTFSEFERQRPIRSNMEEPRGGKDFPNLDSVVREHIQKALAETRGKVEGPRGAAELLGLNPGTLRHRMRKLNIPFGRKAKS